MKGIPAYSLLVKVARGVFQRCVETSLEFCCFGPCEATLSPKLTYITSTHPHLLGSRSGAPGWWKAM